MLLAGAALGWLVCRAGTVRTAELLDVDPPLSLDEASEGVWPVRMASGSREFYVDAGGREHPILPAAEPEGTAS